MRIIALYNGIYPNGYAPMSRRLHYYMKALMAENEDVEVIIPSSITQNCGSADGVKYSFVKIPPKKRYNKYRIKRRLKHICSVISKHCDAILLISFEYSTITSCAKAIKKSGCKVVVEINENPGSIYASRLDNRFTLWLKHRYYLKKVLPCLDGTIVISHALEELIASQKSFSGKIVRIPILCNNPDKTKPITKNTIQKPYILHAGALSEQKDGIIAMLKAFAIAHKHLNGNIQFFFTYKVGFSGLIKKISFIIRENNLKDDVHFTGVLSNEDLDTLRNGALLSIVNKPINEQNIYNFPTKISEILYAGIPLVVSRTGELQYYFKDEENSYVVDPDNIEQIANKIIYIAEHPSEVQNVIEHGKQLCEKEFYYMNHSKSIASFFNSL